MSPLQANGTTVLLMLSTAKSKVSTAKCACMSKTMRKDSLPLPTSHLTPRTSHIPQTSQLRHLTSDPRPLTSDLELQTSDLRPQASDLRHQTSNLRPPTSNLRPQMPNLRPQTSNLRAVLLGFGVPGSQGIPMARGGLSVRSLFLFRSFYCPPTFENATRYDYKSWKSQPFVSSRHFDSWNASNPI